MTYNRHFYSKEQKLRIQNLLSNSNNTIKLENEGYVALNMAPVMKSIFIGEINRKVSQKKNANWTLEIKRHHAYS